MDGRAKAQAQRVLIPFHFGTRWDILPNRVDKWKVIQHARLSDRLREAATTEATVFVGGDCMTAIAAQARFQKLYNGDDSCLVWYDAHGDFHTLLTTETGHLGGMPLAMLCGLGDQSLLKLCACESLATKVVHVGGSTFDDGERVRMIALGVDVLPRWRSQCTADDWNVHLHIDTDVICVKDHPSSIHPPTAGLTLAELWEDLERLLPAVRVLSIKSYDPRLDASGAGERIVTEILRRFDER